MAKQKFRATSVKVSRLKAGPNKFENERIDVEVAVPENRSAAEAVAAARGFIARQFGEVPSSEQIAAARELIEGFENIGDLA